MGNPLDWLADTYDYAKDHVLDYVEDVILPQFTDNPVSEWLYEDNWSKGKYAVYLGAHGVPVVGQYFDWLLGMRQAQEYLDRYQLDWSDIHNPNRLPGGLSGSTSGLMHGGLNFVSDNFKRLYR